MDPTIRDQINERLARMPLAQQRRVLEFASRLADAQPEAELVRDAAQHVSAVAVLSIDEDDERIVDELMAKFRADRPSSPL
jgi:hypothetical protein